MHYDQATMSVTPASQPALDPLLADFFEEAACLLDAFHDHLLVWESPSAGPTSDDLLPARWSEMFRAMHTLKGLAGMFGLTTVHQLAHEVEDVLQTMRQRRAIPARDVIDVLFVADDRMLQLLEALAQGHAEPCCAEVIDRLRSVLALDEVADATSTSCRAENSESHEPAARPMERSVRVLADQLDRFAQLAERMNVARASLAEVCGELQPSPAADALRDTLVQLEQLAADLQRTVADACLTTLEPVLRRLRRVVREVARQSGKSVRLRIDGGDVRIDKRLADQMAQVLVPLVQNAVDHGIETPDERARAGKPATGTVTITAQRAADRLLLHVADDGRGLDAEAITARAVEQRLIEPHQAGRLTQAEIVQLITAPGLSTARQVTTTSGRGVGMDIVRDRIEALGGRLQIDTQAGHGTKFRIELPARGYSYF